MTSSIRNIPLDIASARILSYLRTHNYDDCALYINRLSSNTFRKILSNYLPIDTLLAQLPFSIEIFEIAYSKIFIYDPDIFPVRILKPEKIISKMISLFATSFIEKSITTSVSTAQTKQEIVMDDERLLTNLSSLLRIISYVQPILFKRLLHQKETIDECILFFEQSNSNATSIYNTLKKSPSTTSLIQKNLEETIRQELESTINCCQQALHSLDGKATTARTLTSSHTTPIATRKTSSISTTHTTPSSFDDIQNRLFQHKAILNIIEPHLSRTKLYSVIDNLGNKVSMDKQILLAYSHIKTHEKQIPFGEPLLPLFKRFAFAYERIIQLWRRVTDSALIDECTDDIIISHTATKDGSGFCFERARSHTEILLYKDDMAFKNEPVEYFYAQEPHIINGRIPKQQPANKLVNGYLSTAANYINRAKSFHLPTTNHNNSNIQVCLSVNHTLPNSITHSIPNKMDNVNVPASINIHSDNLLIFAHQTNSSILPSNDNTNNTNNNHSIDSSKSQGIVSTLRRSLRKNKERFYNKRSTAMKSCHSLNTYEQTMADNQDIHLKSSMTPILLCRHQTSVPTIETCSMRNIIVDNGDDDEMPPLQPLTMNGREQRNRILANGSIAQQQLSSILPPATSLQSLSPMNTSMNSPGNILPSTSNVEQQTMMNLDYDEREKLKNDLQQMKIELQKSKETIARLQKSEEQMRERLAEQAQRQLEKGGKFEDLNQISRPTELIRSYNTLYSQARIDALDALENVREMSDAEDLKSKLLFSVVVLAFRHAHIQAKDIRNKIKQILQLSNDKSSITIEETIEKYLRSTILKYDVGKVAVEVENQLWTTLYDYPALKNCHELLKYINSACRTAWGLVNQTPPYYIEFQAIKFDRLIHERFHTSDNDSDTINEYIWPCLIDGRDRTCVAKGVVITDEHYLSMSKHLSS
ncbi:unnamed protein product [Rotaria magnacalcarata]|uniref:Mitochondria-eating protein n=2 Tax=Rotaria magnacalcarata TaxID=392030 RepID=A0A819AVJ4_9BILA|nr:unnamed protein product [Rotaria magnacalcarata]